MTSKELSKLLNVNLARWKRWSREFLPPDPLAGMQSGLSRQFTPGQAFEVYLGGALVGHLKFTIPDARTILGDLREWLMGKRLHPDSSFHRSDLEMEARRYQVLIWPADTPGRFIYEGRGIIATTPAPYKAWTVMHDVYIEDKVLPTIGAAAAGGKKKDLFDYRILEVSIFYDALMALFHRRKA